eukprot:SAG25_NODE_1561_length_2763_cov_2.143018_1_plen_61_part_10
MAAAAPPPAPPPTPPPALSVQDLRHHQARSEGLTQRNQRCIDELRQQESGRAVYRLYNLYS